MRIAGNEVRMVFLWIHTKVLYRWGERRQDGHHRRPWVGLVKRRTFIILV
jgi:hypothetical protein